MTRPNIVNLEMEDLRDMYNINHKTEQYIHELKSIIDSEKEDTINKLYILPKRWNIVLHNQRIQFFHKALAKAYSNKGNKPPTGSL